MRTLYTPILYRIRISVPAGTTYRTITMPGPPLPPLPVPSDPPPPPPPVFAYPAPPVPPPVPVTPYPPPPLPPAIVDAVPPPPAARASPPPASSNPALVFLPSWFLSFALRRQECPRHLLVLRRHRRVVV